MGPFGKIVNGVTIIPLVRLANVLTGCLCPDQFDF